ncbi:hypothetical protein DCS_02448 [Drechmeria coniospora]|uniref:Cystathionine gamma-synthase n=1 Tax=Drechmeria coniospora TaxID=98403 RepID=A0A151GW24_DRECN|nr:hypothetical protein DCS_02448 [Drechmeria coniospora]KYK61306.1 hypothetical protein DCS_02448 [Drechmeria coniospora]
MSPPAPYAHGMAVPDRLHAVSVQIASWQDVCAIAVADEEALKTLRNGYPRSYVHKSIRALIAACEREFSLRGRTLMLFSNPVAARGCRAYMSSTARHGASAALPESISLCRIEFGTATMPEHKLHLPPLYAAIYPPHLSRAASLFWRLTGTGISSRQAGRCLQALDRIRQVDEKVEGAMSLAVSNPSHSAYDLIRARLALLAERAPVGGARARKVTGEDVHLYPSGMSAIYHTHHLLLDWRGAESIVMGFTYELTMKMMEAFGPSYRFFSGGTDGEMDEFERHLEATAERGATIQAVWCECASNPLLRTTDLARLRRLADKYDFVLVVDDTIGTCANVDVLSVADIVVTSLTKWFNGFADVLAGSIILNPNSAHYGELKGILDGSYVNNLHVDDAAQLEKNSRDFLQRVARVNETAEHLVDRMVPLAADPRSIVSKVYYPKLCWSAANYRARMRPATDEFAPGYGGLFTIEFDTVRAAARFLDAVPLHKGPSIGANVTLVLPYVQMVFQTEKEWAARNGVNETIVRISVGLEDREALLRCILLALEEAEQLQARL